MLAQLLEDSQIVSNLSYLRTKANRDLIAQHAPTWNEMLRAARIPTARLPAVFNHAHLHRDPSHPFCLADVQRAWTELKSSPALLSQYMREIETENLLIPPADPACVICHGSGNYQRRRCACRQCPNCFDTRLEVVEARGARRCGRCCPPLKEEEYG